MTDPWRGSIPDDLLWGDAPSELERVIKERQPKASPPEAVAYVQPVDVPVCRECAAARDRLDEFNQGDSVAQGISRMWARIHADDALIRAKGYCRHDCEKERADARETVALSAAAVAMERQLANEAILAAVLAERARCRAVVCRLFGDDWRGNEALEAIGGGQ